MITQLGEGMGSRGIVHRSSGWREHQADAATRPSLPFHRELGGATETTRGGKGSCRRGEPCGAGHGVTPFGGDDTASGACSGDSRHRLSRASCKAAAVAVALLNHVCLEGQRPSNTVEFLPRRKDRGQYNSQSLLTLGRTLTKNKPQALHSGWPCGSRLQRGVVAVLQFVHCVCPSPPVGDIPPIETLPDPPEAAATTVASPDTDNLRSTVTPPDVPMLVLPLLCWRIGPTPVRVGALPIA